MQNDLRTVLPEKHGMANRGSQAANLFLFQLYSTGKAGGVEVLPNPQLGANFGRRAGLSVSVDGEPKRPGGLAGHNISPVDEEVVDRVLKAVDKVRASTPNAANYG